MCCVAFADLGGSSGFWGCGDFRLAVVILVGFGCGVLVDFGCGLDGFRFSWVC